MCTCTIRVVDLRRKKKRFQRKDLFLKRKICKIRAHVSHVYLITLLIRISFLGDIHITHIRKTLFCFVCLLLPHTVLKYYDKDDGGFSLVVLVFFEQRAQNKAKEYWKEKSKALCQNEGGKNG